MENNLWISVVLSGLWLVAAWVMVIALWRIGSMLRALVVAMQKE